MAYGHAERNLALIRQLEAETRQLLDSLDHPVSEQAATSRDGAAGAAADTCLPHEAPGRAYRQPSAGATWVRMLSMTWAL
jgi:hypothetical protein